MRDTTANAVIAKETRQRRRDFWRGYKYRGATATTPLITADDVVGVQVVTVQESNESELGAELRQMLKKLQAANASAHRRDAQL